jgi:hypothetical protein
MSLARETVSQWELWMFHVMRERLCVRTVSMFGERLWVTWLFAFRMGSHLWVERLKAESLLVAWLGKRRCKGFIISKLLTSS